MVCDGWQSMVVVVLEYGDGDSELWLSNFLIYY